MWMDLVVSGEQHLIKNDIILVRQRREPDQIIWVYLSIVYEHRRAYKQFTIQAQFILKEKIEMENNYICDGGLL